MTEEFDEGEEENIPIVRKIVHEIRDKRMEPKRKPKHKTEDQLSGEEPKEEDEQSVYAFRSFERLKTQLIRDFPQHVEAVKECDSVYALEDLREDLELEKKPPSGTATLISEQKPNQLSTGNSYIDLINKQRLELSKPHKHQKQLARQQQEQMLKSVVERGDTLRAMKGSTWSVCPSCGGLNPSNTFSRRGHSCQFCSHEIGKPIRKRTY